MIIFDLDGTVADIEHRRHFVTGDQWTKFYEACVDDEPNWPVIHALVALSKRYRIEIWSARSEIVRPQTEVWLTNLGLPHKKLRMRPIGNSIPDDILKQNWVNEVHSAGGVIHMVFDDRNKVVAMWRRNDIPCFQVTEGDF